MTNKLIEFEGKEVDLNLIKPLILAIYINIETRFGYIKKRGPINFLELLNNLWPFVEIIRSSLLASNNTSTIGTEYSKKLFMLLNDILSFEDKWGITYTSWLQNFKSKHASSQGMFNTPEPYLYEDLQSFYRHTNLLYEESEDLLTKVYSISKDSAELLEYINKQNTSSQSIFSKYKRIFK